MSSSLWHPFANMAVVAGNEFILDRAEGIWVYDTEGRKYMDASASLWYSNIGHGNTEVIERVRDQLERLDCYSTFVDYSNRPAMELADRLAELSPLENAKVFLVSGGGDAIDTAAKLARSYWQLNGEPHRTHLLSRANAYHGTHGYGTSLGGIEGNVSGWGPLLPDVGTVSHDSVAALEQSILDLGPENVAGFFCEPVIGAGGVIPPPEGYIEAVADLLTEHGILFICDSVICGFGRLGTWYGIERWPGVKPDMIVIAKGVTSGYQPLGGVVVDGRVAAPFWEGEGAAFRHGPTYAGHPACAAAALANLDILARDDLLSQGQNLERPLADALAPLADRPEVAEVRAGLGLLAAVELKPELLRAEPAAVNRLTLAARREGMLVRPLGSAIAVSPPLTVTEAEIKQIAAAIEAAFEQEAFKWE